jgi:site-specific recombinase XerD
MTDLEPTGDALPAQPDRDRNAYWMYMLALRGNTESRRTMGACLDRIATKFAEQFGFPAAPSGAEFPWHQLRATHTAVIKEILDRQEWSPAYVNKHLTALRRVLWHAWKLDLMDTDAYMRAVAVENLTAVRLPPGRSIAKPEIAAMLRVCIDADTILGKRDAAIIAVLHSTGARREEIAAMTRTNYDPGARAIRIIGKRDREREVYIHETAALYLGGWLLATERIKGPLFCPIDRWGNVRDAPMSTTAVGALVENRRREAGLPKLTTHDFRRTFIGELLDAGVDLATAQQLAGHESASTTTRYDRRPARQRKASVDLLSLPTPEELSS